MKQKVDIDNHHLQYHPDLVTKWKNGEKTYPLYVEIGPTAACNNRCVYCALDFLKYKPNYLQTEILEKTITELGKNGTKSILFAGEGEPTMHKDLDRFARACTISGIKSALSTNGLAFDRHKQEGVLPHLSWMRFSLSAATPTTYKKVHGIHFDKFDQTIKNIRSSVELKKKLNLNVTIGVQWLLIKQNVMELERAFALFKSLGVDNLQIKPYSYHPRSERNLNEKYKRYEKELNLIKHYETETFRILWRTQTMQRLSSEGEYNICHGLDFFALIDAKGNVIPCNMFYDKPEFTYGNINNQPFKEIWFSKQREKVKAKIKKQGLDTCRNGCRLDAVNRYLHRIKKPYPHDDFL